MAIMKPLSIALLLLFVSGVSGAACGSGGAPRSIATTTVPASSTGSWWQEPARFVPTDADRITYISNMAAIAKSYGLASLPDCASVFATPASVDLAVVRQVIAHGRLDPLLMYVDATTHAYTGFDPCAAGIVVEGAASNPEDDYYAYSADNADADVMAALSQHGYTKSTDSTASVFSQGADHGLASQKYLSALNRVAVFPGWVVTASATAPIHTAVVAYGGASPIDNRASIDNQMLAVLGDFDAVALLGTARMDQGAIKRARAMIPVQLPSTWSPLLLPDRVALAWKRSDETDVLKFSLYYASADKVEAQADEFANRLRSYTTLSAAGTLCSSAEATVTKLPSGAMVVATCTTNDAVTLHGLLVTGDVTLLLANRTNEQ